MPLNPMNLLNMSNFGMPTDATLITSAFLSECNKPMPTNNKHLKILSLNRQFYLQQAMANIVSANSLQKIIMNLSNMSSKTQGK